MVVILVDGFDRLSFFLTSKKFQELHNLNISPTDFVVTPAYGLMLVFVTVGVWLHAISAFSIFRNWSVKRISHVCLDFLIFFLVTYPIVTYIIYLILKKVK